jgi:hypothetical protein
MTKISNQYSLTNILTADLTNSRLGVNNTNPSHSLDLTGDARVGGSLTVTGNLTAQQFIVSSSVTYLTESFASGSHKFGDSSDDNHNFTGSLIVSGSANPLRVGSNLLFVSSSGFIGINNVSPTVALDVTGAGKFSGALTAGGKIFTSTSVNDNIIELINSDTTNGYGLYVRAGGTASGRYVARFKNGADADVMWLDKGGNLGLGTTTPSFNANQISLTINGTNVSRIDMQVSGTRNAGFVVASDAAYLETTAAIPLVFYTNSAERMRITNDGTIRTVGPFQFGNTNEMFIGRGSAISGIYQAYDLVLTNFQTSGRVVINANTGGNTGVYLANGGNSWTAWSDERLKTDLTPIVNASEKVSKIRAMIGRYKTDNQSVKRSFLIAQDVLEVLPEATNLDEVTGMYGVQYTDVIPLLVASIKELSAENTSLINRIEALENK